MNTILTGSVAPLPATRAGALRHIKQLDALRAFAVGSVMVADCFPTLNRFGEWGAMGGQPLLRYFGISYHRDFTQV
jgi:peptidoglycan/LPS O-acetylase OafA/YrhL